MAGVFAGIRFRNYPELERNVILDFTAMTDEALAAHLNEVLDEQERRKALAEIPEQIRELTAKYVAGGGQVEDLQPEVPITE